MLAIYIQVLSSIIALLGSVRKMEYSNYILGTIRRLNVYYFQLDKKHKCDTFLNIVIKQNTYHIMTKHIKSCKSNTQSLDPNQFIGLTEYIHIFVCLVKVGQRSKFEFLFLLTNVTLTGFNEHENQATKETFSNPCCWC